MTAETENLVLEILKNVQRDIATSSIANQREFAEIKQRLGAVEQQLGSLRRDVGIDAGLRAMLMSKVDEHSEQLKNLPQLH